MVFNLFFFTITISMRKVSGIELEQAYNREQNEQRFDKQKQRCLSQARLM